jgi:hypothetical protein
MALGWAWMARRRGADGKAGALGAAFPFLDGADTDSLKYDLLATTVD